MAGPADSCSLLPGRIGQCTRFFERKHRVHSRGFWLVFCVTLLSYTFVKFNQEKNEVGTPGDATRYQASCGRRQVASPALQDLSISLLQDGLGSACAQRLLASLTRAGFPRACFPKTVSSTRLQYASMIFAFSADSPLVTCISGPNPESVAVRLTIM